MFVIDEEIKVCEHGFEEVKKAIIRGSDTHLDYLLRVKNALDNLSLRIEKFVDDIEIEVNEYPNEQIVPLMPRVSDLHTNCKSLLTALKGSTISKDLKSSCHKYEVSVELLREFVYDMTEIRLNEKFWNEFYEKHKDLISGISNNHYLPG